MIGFLLRIVATEVIKKNYNRVFKKIKNTSKYIYNRIYIVKREKTIKIYPDIYPKLKRRSNSI
jgi:hypothetical protein